mmetsp:Transcript_6239/g.13810  ORF Transcript_6239/g.13810 Transcript_6239/m.13810 type:complete len:80 (-) Transcript_6239:176-415(-)
MLSRVCYSGISKKEQLLRVTYVNVHVVIRTYIAKQCGNVNSVRICTAGGVRHQKISVQKHEEITPRKATHEYCLHKFGM